MAVIGRLLRARRADEARSAWNRPNLQGPETLHVTSGALADGAAIPREHASKRVGGQDTSPPLAWSRVPAGTAVVLVVVEDLDVPVATPVIHCLALLDPTVAGLPAGGLSAQAGRPGVRVLRSTLGRGYTGPAPIAGHGPHRYVFEVFALGEMLRTPDLDRLRPRRVLDRVTGPVLARGRWTGTYERSSS